MDRQRGVVSAQPGWPTRDDPRGATRVRVAPPLDPWAVALVAALVAAAGAGAWGARGGAWGGLTLAVGSSVWLLAVVALIRAGWSPAEASRRAVLPVLALVPVPLSALDLMLRGVSPRRLAVSLAVAVGVAAAYTLLALDHRERFLAAVEAQAPRLLVALLAVYAAAALAVVAVKYGLSLDHLTGHDTAYHLQLFWNTLHGRPLQGSVLQQLNFNPPVSSNFAFHVELVHWALMPLVAAVPGPVTLVGLKSLLLVLGAVPVYAVMAREADRTVGLLGAVVYLLHPATAAQAVNGFYTVHLAAPLLALTFLGYRRARFGPFLALLVLTNAVREDVALMTAAFGVVALLERRSVRWVLTPAILGLGWWGICYFRVMPAFGAGGGVGYQGVAGLADTGLLGLARQVLGPTTWGYVLQVLKPGALLSLLDPSAVLLLPVTAINAVTAIAFRGAPLRIHSYQSTLVPVVVACSLLGALRAARWLTWTGLPGRTLRVGLAALGIPLAILASKDALSSPVRAMGEARASAPSAELLAEIPTSAAVAAPVNLLPTLAGRTGLYWVERVPDYTAPVDPDVVIVASDGSAFQRLDILARPGARDRYLAWVASLESRGYRRSWADSHYTVYAR
jgi:hypothetical protein